VLLYQATNSMEGKKGAWLVDLRRLLRCKVGGSIYATTWKLEEDPKAHYLYYSTQEEQLDLLPVLYLSVWVLTLISSPQLEIQRQRPSKRW